MSMNIDKILNRVRKLLELSEHTTSEAEAASAAAQASKLMEEYQLSEALVRLEDPQAPKEEISEEYLEPSQENNRPHKRVAWKETIAAAVANDLGVHMYFWTQQVNFRNVTTVRGMGRASAIQAWQYTCQYLWRAVDEITQSAWETYKYTRGLPDTQFGGTSSSARAWKNAFRVGCAGRLAVRLHENKSNQDLAWQQAKAAANSTPDSSAQVMTFVEKDREEVSNAYKKRSKGFGTAKRVGQVTSRDGYTAGIAAGDQVHLGGGRAGLDT